MSEIKYVFITVAVANELPHQIYRAAYNPSSAQSEEEFVAEQVMDALADDEDGATYRVDVYRHCG